MADNRHNEGALAYAEEADIKAEFELTEPVKIQADADTEPELAQQAEDVVARVLSVKPGDLEGQNRSKAAIETMGLEVQREAARRSTTLKQPIAQLSGRAEDGGEVANALIDLKVRVEELDPGKFDFNAGWFARAAGRIPGVGTPIKRYFSRYESASTVIDAILRSLKNGQEQLKRDNITLAADQKAMRALTIRLEKAIKLGQLIDTKLEEKLATEMPTTDPRHTFVQEELLFPLRQRIQDLQQQLLVNQQGFLTVEMIIRNNKELIRGVNRAVNVTVSALQVAVTLAMALAHQKITLEKVQAVSDTTSKLITGTAAQLRAQGAEIHKQAAGTQLDIDALKQAFGDIRHALDDVSRYRQDALPKMAQRVVEMDKLAAQSEETIKRVEHAAEAVEGFPIEVIDEE